MEPRLEPHPIAAPKIWQVCFVDCGKDMWWARLFPRGFSHVFLLGYVPSVNAWILFDTLAEKTEIGIVTAGYADALITSALGAGGVLCWTMRDPPRFSVLRHIGSWCVPAVRHVLGLGCVAITPKGLHDFLLKNGARPFAEIVDEFQRQGTKA